MTPQSPELVVDSVRKTVGNDYQLSDYRQIRRVLVANRGEIARRVIRTVHAMGLQAVAIHSDPDADAPFVREADLAVAIGGRTSAESYLIADKVLSAARRAGADAIHPGYGFLSESARFARAVQDAGLAWIGPDPEAIELLGDKARARALAAQVGAPLVPGTNGTPAAATSRFASTFSAIARIESGVGPIQTSPASATAAAKSGFSERNPYPG